MRFLRELKEGGGYDDPGLFMIVRNEAGRQHSCDPVCNTTLGDEGPVTLTVPATLSEASYGDLADQFELFLRRAKRRVSKPSDEDAN